MPDRHALSNQEPADLSRLVHRTLAVVAVLVVVLFLWKIHQALLIAFAGVLVAVFIRGLARQLERRTRLSIRWSQGLVLAAIVAVTVGFWWVLGPRIVQQFSELSRTLPETFSQLRSDLAQSQTGQALLQQLSGSDGQAIDSSILSRIPSAAMRAANFVLGLLMVLFIGIFLIVDPDMYRRGAVLLVPKKYHDEARDVLDTLGHALWQWLVGRFVAILFVFASVSVLLWVVGVPLALVLGFIAGAFDFVPWIGPIASALPAILLAFTLGPTKALYVAAGYLIIQQLEGNLITPLVQQQAVSLPPVLVLLALTGFGLLFGLMGILLATPLLVVGMVLVNKLYIEEALGEEVTVPGED